MYERGFEIKGDFRGNRKLSKETCLIKYTFLIGYKIIRRYFRERIFLRFVCKLRIIYAILIQEGILQSSEHNKYTYFPARLSSFNICVILRSSFYSNERHYNTKHTNSNHHPNESISPPSGFVVKENNAKDILSYSSFR